MSGAFHAGRELGDPSLTRHILALHRNCSIITGVRFAKNIVDAASKWSVKPSHPWGHVANDLQKKDFQQSLDGMRAALLLGAVLVSWTGSTLIHLPSSPWTRQRAPLILGLNRWLERVRSDIQRSGVRGWERLQFIFSSPKNLMRGKLPGQNSGSHVVRNIAQRLVSRLKLPKGTSHRLNRLRWRMRDSAVRGLARLQSVSKIPQQGLRGNLPYQGGGAHVLRNLAQRLKLPKIPKRPSVPLPRPHGLRSPQTSYFGNIFNRMFPAVERLQRNTSQRLKKLTNLRPYLNQYQFLKRS